MYFDAIKPKKNPNYWIFELLVDFFNDTQSLFQFGGHHFGVYVM